MSNILYIGIDPSINSTGVTVEQNGYQWFYVISSKLTKKLQKDPVITGDSWEFQYLLYPKDDESHDVYWERERRKTVNFISIIEYIRKILSKFTYDTLVVGIEGISYGSTSRTSAVYDLAGLNYLIRTLFINDNLFVISPSDNKKFATGKGNANKDVMLVGFRALYPEITSAVKKADDVCDSYFLKEYAKRIFNSKK